MLYARSLLLRNCGRFTHVSSDFGSQYHTHTFVTSEALYASLTREATWRHTHKFVDLEEDAKKPTGGDYFFCDYDVEARAVWFTPGIFVDHQLRALPKQKGVVDKNDFNVVDEGYPSTGGKRVDGTDRRFFCPTYGRIESILPDHRLFTYAVSPGLAELERFAAGQIFIMGKKRTMFQIMSLSSAVEGAWESGECMTSWLETPPNYAVRFHSFEVLAATFRYIILRGKTPENGRYLKFDFPQTVLCLPDFYVELAPLRDWAVV